MIRKSDLKRIFERIAKFGADQSIVFSDETGLIHYGVIESSLMAHVGVSSTLFHHITKTTGHPIVKICGQRAVQLDHDIVLYEGVNLGSVYVEEGYWVYPFKNTKARLEIRGYKGLLDLPAVKEPATPPQKEAKRPAWSELSEAEMDYEARCKRADWYYSFSDDQRVWRAGKAECEALQKIAKTNGGNYELIYEHYSAR